MNNQKGMELLGLKAKDMVTGYEGTIESISYDLYGCIQACVRPPYAKNDNGDLGKSFWFDIARLKASGKPVMPVPDFTADDADEHGPAEKPSR